MPSLFPILGIFLCLIGFFKAALAIFSDKSQPFAEEHASEATKEAFWICFIGAFFILLG